MSIECPKCQHENPDETAFCGKCGTKFDTGIDHTKTLQSPGIEKLIANKYEIIEEIGRGGMGIVYKAKDIKLDRTVALKFLPPGVSHDKEAKERFIQEAKAASGLDHTNICTIYEIGEAEEEQMFIAMPYYEGESLKEIIGKKPLEIEEAVSISTQIAEGLSRAHKKEIVHRDIKPANIMITEEGVVKIVDFGIVKLGGEARLTQTGSTVGTTAYMSPEQIRGEKVDSRSDIWSLGVVLYEMLTGQLPFEGDQMQSMFYSILNKDPEAAASVRKEVPRYIEQVIMKALEKDLNKRFQSVDELKLELQTSPSVTFPEPEKSIAVLPFLNISADPEQEYFCDGMTEEIINALTNIENLKVIARTSVFMFKDKHEDIREIGKKLDVKHLLEGSVRRAGTKLRITAQLIKVDDGSHLWSKKYDREMEDIFDIQDEISLAIVENLKVNLLGREKEALLKRSTTNEYAYNIYLQGRFHWNKMTLMDLENAVTCFNKAIELDPNFALAYFGLADTYWMLHQVVPLPADEALPKTKDAALKALAIDDTLAEAYAVVGMVLFSYEWKWSEAEEYLKKAYSLNPRSGPVKMYYSAFLQYTDRKLESIQMMEETLETDPYSLIFNGNVAIRLYIAERYEDAIQKCEDILRMEPNFWPAYQFIGRAYLCLEMYDKAEQALVKSNELLGGVPETLPLLGYAYAKQGKTSKARDIISILDKESKKIYIPVFYYAYVYKGLGEIDKTFEYLEKSIEERDPRVVWWIRYIPFTNLRNDRRYANVIRRLGMEFLEKELMEQFPLDGTKPSIIVLPFEDLSPGKDNEYFSDGLTDEIITDLSQIHDLLVISRSSAMTFKGTKKKVKDIARELNVLYVLEGSVRKAANKLRITAQLIDGTNDTHLWAEKYSGNLDDVFEIQEKVSRSIVEALKLRLSPEEEKKLSERPIDNIGAYDCYLKANVEIWKFTEEDINRGIRHLQDGLDIMGDNALLYSGMAYAVLQLVNIGAKQDKDLAESKEIAKKALALDPESEKAHAVLGWIALWENPRQVIHHFKKALSIYPNDAFALQGLAVYHIQVVGGIAEATRILKRLIRIDPLHFATNNLQGLVHIYDGEYNLSIPHFRRTFDLFPDNVIVQFYYAMALAYLGQMDQAFVLIDQNANSAPNNAFSKLGLMLKYAVQKKKDKVFHEMTTDFQKTCLRDITFSHHLAGIFSLTGAKKEALNWLENAVDGGFINYPLLSKKDLFLENIRGEERFKKLMERVKYEWENFEV